MIAHCIISSPGNYKRVAALHDKSVGSGFVNAMSFLRRCSENNALIFSKNKDKGFDSGYDMSATINGIADTIDRRIAMLSNGKYENIIEYNEFYDNMQDKAEDASPIYGGRNLSVQNNIVRYNYFHNQGVVDCTIEVWYNSETNNIIADVIW